MICHLCVKNPFLEIQFLPVIDFEILPLFRFKDPNSPGYEKIYLNCTSFKSSLKDE